MFDEWKNIDLTTQIERWYRQMDAYWTIQNKVIVQQYVQNTVLRQLKQNIRPGIFRYNFVKEYVNSFETKALYTFVNHCISFSRKEGVLSELPLSKQECFDAASVFIFCITRPYQDTETTIQQIKDLEIMREGKFVPKLDQIQQSFTVGALAVREYMSRSANQGSKTR